MIDLKHRVATLRTRVERSLRRRLRQSENPGRGLDVRPDDTFIVSYPKSGNTWTRFLVASLLHPSSPTDFSNIDERCPTIYKASTTELAALPGPRVLKSHEYFDPRYRRAIYIVRDPRDVLVSYFHYQHRKGFIDASVDLPRFADDFLAGRLNSFGTWQENVASWFAARGERSDFLLLRYEEMLANPTSQLTRIARFLEHSITEQELARVVESCSFERMRALESSTGSKSRHMRAAREDIGFVRKGKSGGWQQEVPPAVIAKLEAAWGPLITRLGYALSKSSRVGS